MTGNNKITSKLNNSGLHALVWQEDDLFVAKCLEIEVASQGISQAEALSNLEEATDLYLADEKVSIPVSYHNPQVFPFHYA